MIWKVHWRLGLLVGHGYELPLTLAAPRWAFFLSAGSFDTLPRQGGGAVRKRTHPFSDSLRISAHSHRMLPLARRLRRRRMRHSLGGKPAHQQVKKASITYQDQKNQQYNPAQHSCNEGPNHNLSSLQVLVSGVACMRALLMQASTDTNCGRYDDSRSECLSIRCFLYISLRDAVAPRCFHVLGEESSVLCQFLHGLKQVRSLREDGIL